MYTHIYVSESEEGMGHSYFFFNEIYMFSRADMFIVQRF